MQSIARPKVVAAIGLGIIFLCCQPVRAQYQALKGVLVGPPTCASGIASGQTSCAAEGTDNSLYGIGFDPASKVSTGYRSLGGTLTGKPTARP